jgi:hypothetical protein
MTDDLMEIVFDSWKSSATRAKPLGHHMVQYGNVLAISSIWFKK